MAELRNIPLTAEHLIFGCPRAELDALVDQMKPRATDAAKTPPPARSP